MRPLIVGNWKMHGTVASARGLARAAREASAAAPGADVAVCPPFVHLAAVAEALAGSPVKWGAQDLFWEEKGAFTGEVSPAMLRDLACAHAIVGHSERRHILGEKDAEAGRKVRAALKAGLTPILCVGELLEERDRGETESVVQRQMAEGLLDLSPEEVRRAVVAYEPVWAIGTGRTATPKQAQEVHAFIRRLLSERAGGDAAGIPILYGGSVKPDNIAGLRREPDVDGALVGGASLDAAAFKAIVAGAVLE